MEVKETVDDIWELVDKVYIYATRTYESRWRIKASIKQSVGLAELISGDSVYFPSRHSRYGFKQCEQYLASIGCTRSKDIDSADKILIDPYNYYYLGAEDLVNKPTELSDVMLNRHKIVRSSSFYDKVRDYQDSLRPRFEFDFTVYENIWTMLKSNDYNNIRMAASAIMTANWTGNEFLLEFLVIHFNEEMRTGHLGSFNKWSDFANTHNLRWKNRETSAWHITEIMKKYLITPEQTQLIHKLLNK